MKDYLVTIALITALFSFNSCSYFSNDEEEKQNLDHLKWKQEREINANKDYQYINQSVSYETRISRDTIAIVLREYYKTYKGFTFNKEKNKLEEIDGFETEYDDDKKHKLDFINDIVKKQFVNEKSAYIACNEIDKLFDIKIMKDDIQSIEESASDINSHFKK